MAARLNDEQAEDAMWILRLLLAVVLIAVLGAFVMGYVSNRTAQSVSVPGQYGHVADSRACA